MFNSLLILRITQACPTQAGTQGPRKSGGAGSKVLIIKVFKNTILTYNTLHISCL